MLSSTTWKVIFSWDGLENNLGLKIVVITTGCYKFVLMTNSNNLIERMNTKPLKTFDCLKCRIPRRDFVSLFSVHIHEPIDSKRIVFLPHNHQSCLPVFTKLFHNFENCLTTCILQHAREVTWCNFKMLDPTPSMVMSQSDSPTMMAGALRMVVFFQTLNIYKIFISSFK